MTHLTEEELILYHYREAEIDRAEVDAHLRQCLHCRQELEAIEASLQLVDSFAVPDRGERYAAEVYERVEHRLGAGQGRWSRLVQPRSWAVAAALAVVIAGAFLAGRFWSREDVTTAVDPNIVGEKLLMVALSDHLDRVQVLLTEVRNTPRQGVADFSLEKEVAREWVETNRLYRLSAGRLGEVLISDLLEQLERVLLEVANGPERRPPDQVESLQDRLESEQLLFKVRVLRERSLQRQAPVRRLANRDKS